MSSFLDRITRAQMTYDGLNRVIDKTQPAPPLAKMTPLKALKPSYLSAKIASASINDQELLRQNDKVGVMNRKKSQTPKIMTKLENELVKQFQLEEPSGFSVIDPETGSEIKRKFNIEGIDPPDLDRDPSGTIRGFEDRIFTADDTTRAIQLMNRDKEIDYQEYRDYKFAKEEREAQLANLIERINRSAPSAAAILRQDVERLERQIYALRRAMDSRARAIDTHYDIEFQKLKEDIAEHNALVIAKKQRNTEAIKQYQAQLNLLNSGAFKTEKMANETEEQYYERLRQNAEEIIPEQQLELAENKILIEFRKLLQDITKDAVKIDQISNSLTPEDKYQLIKIWSLVKERYNRAYGLNNKSIDSETIIAFLNTLIHGIEESSQLPSAVQSVISQINEGGVAQEGELIITPEIGNNQIIIRKSNISGQPPLFIRVLQENARRADGLYQILYSFSGEVGTFKMYLPILHRPVPVDRRPLNSKGQPSNRGGHSDVEIKERTGITTGDLNKLVGFDRHSFNPSTVAKKLVEKYHIIPFKPNDEGVNHRKYGTYGSREGQHDEYGMGIPKVNEPKLVQFGNVMISLPNLKYKNILSVRTHLGKTIGGTPNVKISAKLSSIILNLLEHIQPTHEELHRLDKQERQLYDRLVYLGRLHTKLPQTNDKSIDELKKRLKLLEGEINIGNNSPQISSDIKHILYSLRDFNVITPKQIKDYLTKNSI
jgi:hypothetical protein